MLAACSRGAAISDTNNKDVARNHMRWVIFIIVFGFKVFIKSLNFSQISYGLFSNHKCSNYFLTTALLELNIHNPKKVSNPLTISSEKPRSKPQKCLLTTLKTRQRIGDAMAIQGVALSFTLRVVRMPKKNRP